MPTYAYECAACGHRFEEFQTMTAAPLKKCPQCAKSRLQRLIGAGAGVIFKGTGFYQTDYKKNGGAKTEGEKPKADEAAKKTGGEAAQPAPKNDKTGSEKK